MQDSEPYITQLVQYIGYVNPDATPAVKDLVTAGVRLLQSDETFLSLSAGLFLAGGVLTAVGIVVPLTFPVFGVLGIGLGILGFAVAVLQLGMNAIFNATVALDIVQILNFDFDPPDHTGPRRDTVISFLGGGGGFDPAKIIGETDAWVQRRLVQCFTDPAHGSALKYAAYIIRAVAALNGITYADPTKTVAEDIATNYSSLKRFLQDDFFKNAPDGVIGIFAGSELLAFGDLKTAPPGSVTALAGSPSVISNNDPALNALLKEAMSIWQSALGRPLPLLPTVVVAALPAGVLGETYVANWAPDGKATDATILLSPNAAGVGWYDDPIGTPDPGVFTQSSGNNTSAAQPGSPAYGHYDLLTSLLHEIGHVEGFLPNDPSFEQHVETLNGSQMFVGPGISAALIDSDQELSPSVYAHDLMSATLAPSVQELPSALDVQIIDVINGLAPPAPATGPSGTGSTGTSSPVPPATVVDQAVHSLGSIVTKEKKHKKAEHANKRSVTVKVKHAGASSEHNGTKHRIVVKSPGKTAGKKTANRPHGDLAVHLAKRGSVAKRKH